MTYFTKHQWLLGATILIVGCTSPINSRYRELERAEGLLQEKKYDEAIAIYRSHLEYRLNVEKRSEWENPYFYLLLIGDVELTRQAPEAAYAAYSEALTRKVDRNLISDRMRGIARWYEEKGNLQKSIEILQAHQDLDPLLFDSTLDRLARTIAAAEDPQPLVVGEVGSGVEVR